MMAEPCALCKSEKELRDSHIIPNFVSKWLKSTSATGFLRQASNPNKRVQDLPKLPLLCHDCEQIFSINEKHFAEKLFIPFQCGQKRFDYDEWLMRFIISINWRVGYLELIEQRDDISPKLLDHLTNCLDIWKKYLLGESKKVGASKHHIFFLDTIASVGAETPIQDHANSYFLRATDATVATSKEIIFIYSKLPGVILVSHVYPYDLSRWRSTRVYRRGTIKIPQQCEVPGFGDFLVSRIKASNDLMSNMSESQKNKIGDTVAKNPERLETSRTVQALIADQELRTRYLSKKE